MTLRAHLPTDEEYLGHLLSAWGSPTDDLMAASMLESFPDWLDDLEEDFAQDFRSSAAFSQGHLLNVLKSMALAATGRARASLESVPVAFLPNEEFNACAVRTPRNGAIVLMNSALVHILPFVSMSVAGALSSTMREEMSDTLTRGDCATSLYCLARELVEPGNGFIRTTPLFTDAQIHEKIFTGYELVERNIPAVTAMELFILLHEYGHIALRHLDSDHLRSAKGRSDVQVYTNSQKQEFEADEFAMKCLFRLYKRPNRTRIFTLVSVLFGFFHLMEAMIRQGAPCTSHPPAGDRWMKLRSLTQSGQNKALYPCRPMQLFDEIASVFELAVQRLETTA